MKRTTLFLLAMTVLVVLFASACGSAAPAAQAPADVQQQPAAQQPAAPAQQQQQPAAPVQSFAPACQAAGSCAAPDVKDTEASSTYCVQKIPYQNIGVVPGTTFESLDPKGELKCQDSGTVVDGKNVVTCTGKQLWTYELKLKNSACAANALKTGTGQCQDGQGYDAAQNCCAPITDGGAGSVTIKVNMGACPLPQ
jgi:cytochrome c5